MVRCSSNRDCPVNYFCDSVLNHCDHCRSICNPSQGTSNFCKQECPNYPATPAPTIGTSAFLTTIISTTVTQNNTFSPQSGNNILLPALGLVLFLLLIVIMVIAIGIVCFKLKKKDQLRAKDCEYALREFCCIACVKCFKYKENQNADAAEQISLSIVDAEKQNRQDENIYTNDAGHSRHSEPIQETLPDNESRVVPSGSSETSFNTPAAVKTLSVHGAEGGEIKGHMTIEHNQENKPLISQGKRELQEIPTKSENSNESSNKQPLFLDLEKHKASSKSHLKSNQNVLSQSSIQTQTEKPRPISICTQTEEPYFDLDTFSSVAKLRDQPVNILRPREEQIRPDTSVKNEKHLEEAMKSIVFKPDYENNIDTAGNLVQDAINTRDSPILEPVNGNNDQTNLKALGGLTVPQQETTPLIPEGTTPKPINPLTAARQLHPNRRIYDILKSIYWVQGYYSEGRSIEVYIDYEDISHEKALEELVRRTGERPEKFKILPNEPVQYQSMKFAAII